MRKRYSLFALLLALYAVVIVLWGAWVRISGSGDGCGVHWPLCHGSYLPQEIFHRAQTAIEYLHRAKSGIFGILILVLAICLQRSPEFSVLEKKIAWSSFFFTVTEALLGALLVLAGFVNTDPSSGRAVTVGAHLINTLFLIGSLVMLWVAASTAQKTQSIHFKIKDFFVLSLFIFLAAFGAIASLGSTLFPVFSLQEGFQQDLAGTGPWYLTLRVLHPMLAFGMLMALLWWSNDKNNSATTIALVITIVTLFFGMFTLVVLPRPSWMKLTHLFLADISWICLVRAVSLPGIRRQET